MENPGQRDCCILHAQDTASLVSCLFLDNWAGLQTPIFQQVVSVWDSAFDFGSCSVGFRVVLVFETNDIISKLSSPFWDSFDNSVTGKRSIHLLLRRPKGSEQLRRLCSLFFLSCEVSSSFGQRCRFSLGLLGCLLGVQ